MVNIAWTESSLYEFVMNLSFCKSLEISDIWSSVFFLHRSRWIWSLEWIRQTFIDFAKNYPNNIEVSCSFRVQPSFSYAGRNSGDANIQLSSLKIMISRRYQNALISQEWSNLYIRLESRQTFFPKMKNNIEIGYYVLSSAFIQISGFGVKKPSDQTNIDEMILSGVNCWVSLYCLEIRAIYRHIAQYVKEMNGLQ